MLGGLHVIGGFMCSSAALASGHRGRGRLHPEDQTGHILHSLLSRRRNFPKLGLWLQLSLLRSYNHGW